MTDNIPNSIVGLNSDRVSTKNPADNIAVVDIIAIPVPKRVASFAVYSVGEIIPCDIESDNAEYHR